MKEYRRTIEGEVAKNKKFWRWTLSSISVVTTAAIASLFAAGWTLEIPMIGGQLGGTFLAGIISAGAIAIASASAITLKDNRDRNIYRFDEEEVLSSHGALSTKSLGISGGRYRMVRLRDVTEDKNLKSAYYISPTITQEQLYEACRLAEELNSASSENEEEIKRLKRMVETEALREKIAKLESAEAEATERKRNIRKRIAGLLSGEIDPTEGA